jgi:hypothetical protein
MALAVRDATDVECGQEHAWPPFVLGEHVCHHERLLVVDGLPGRGLHPREQAEHEQCYTYALYSYGLILRTELAITGASAS